MIENISVDHTTTTPLSYEIYDKCQFFGFLADFLNKKFKTLNTFFGWWVGPACARQRHRPQMRVGKCASAWDGKTNCFFLKLFVCGFGLLYSAGIKSMASGRGKPPHCQKVTCPQRAARCQLVRPQRH